MDVTALDSTFNSTAFQPGTQEKPQELLNFISCSISVESSPPQLTMPAQGHKHDPAWSIPEILDLIAVWGEDSVQAERQTIRRKADIYAKIAQRPGDKSYTRDTQQCHVKIKALRQVYQKTREQNSRSGSEPQTWHFYDQLHVILGGDPTSTPILSVDTSQGPQVAMGNNEEDIVDDEEEEEENAQQASGGSILPDSQDLFLTLQPIPSQDLLLRDCDAATLSVGAFSTPARRLSQIRRRKKRTREDNVL
ncbi:uncharacterized protein LOC122464214 [Chelonia mydas]|uniref:uncharacterized protein LOC122464214 n=1 Tax=Chelonia mydas TaxID=8469 RepID=UPI001CA800EA|nr:uncharacterized protein LOC122464214 [Chelonia mydas]